MTSDRTVAAKRLLRWIVLTGLFMATAGIGAYLSLTLMIKGEDTVVVPDLVGKDVLYSLETLSDLGLNTRVRKTDYHERLPRHRIIDQDPPAGTVIKQGRDVKIRVSRGPKTVVMPNLAGLSHQQARIALTENGLCPGNLTRMCSPRHSDRQIMAHVPAAGKTISRNTCVDLLISTGPALSGFLMPDMSGLSLGEAIRQIEQRQLKLGRIHSAHISGAVAESVVDQEPPAGYRVLPHGRIHLTVHRATAEQNHDTHPDREQLFRFTANTGFLKKRVQVKLQQELLSLTIFDDFLAPSQEIWLFIPKHGNPTILVYVDDELVETMMTPQ